MAWKFTLTDLSGTAIGEVLNAYERKLTLPLNGPTTASLRIRLDNPLADEIVTRNGDCLVKVYQGSTLRFVGEITTVEEIAGGDGASLAINAAGALWRLQKRLCMDAVFQRQGIVHDDPVNAILEKLLINANSFSPTPVRPGSFDTLYETKVGPWGHKPIAEAITEMQAAKAPYPIVGPQPSYLVLDNFTGTGVVSGRTPDGGGPAWTSTGTGPDWTVGSDYCTRSGGTEGDGRIAIATVANGSVLAGMDYGTSLFGDYFFLYVRLSNYVTTLNSGDWFRVTIGLDNGPGRFWLEKRTGGTITAVKGPTDFAGVGNNQFWRVRLVVDNSGNYTLWHYRVDIGGTELGAPLASGQDADLVAGAALGDGDAIAFADYNPSASTIGRSFSQVVASDYTGIQSFDFELAPIEPTAAPVKYADLNVKTQIGTTRDAVFEYGAGNRSLKSYHRVIDREGMVNVAYSLPSDYDPAATSSDVRYAWDAASQTARGTFDEVIPGDLVDTQLRQALVDAHVAVRKIPRQEITFEPSEGGPVFGTDFIVGDYVTARAVVNGTVRFNGVFRVYAVEVTIDENGKETVVPTLVPS